MRVRLLSALVAVLVLASLTPATALSITSTAFTPRDDADHREYYFPMGDLAQRAGELDRSKPIVVYCKSGQRSLYSTDELLALGFADVASLNGGIIAWAEAEQPVEE